MAVRVSRVVFAVAAVQFAVLLATASRYGYHRDELYFIVAGSHPASGYPDQPPLVPLVSWAMHAIAPSLTLLRTPSAFASAATTVLAGLVAHEVGGATARRSSQRSARQFRGSLSGLGISSQQRPSTCSRRPRSCGC
jgi:hypothetical protein